MKNKTLNTPIVFRPIYKQLIWGGDRIAVFKRAEIPLENVGESWEISSVPGSESVVAEGEGLEGLTITELVDQFGGELVGSRVYTGGNVFPLLVKLIDAHRNLSVQVHPGDELARERHNSPGKNEMWYILASAPGARIYCGLSAKLTPEIYRRCIESNNIMDYVAEHESTPGQFYYVPAGTIHAIGSGNLVAEIQQTSDITYRVYDYGRLDADGRPRQLHVEEACDAIDYTYPHEVQPTARVIDSTSAGVVATDYFTADFINLGEGEMHSVNHGGESFRIVMVTAGEISIETASCVSRPYGRGTTVLMPASVHSFTIKGPGKALLVGA